MSVCARDSVGGRICARASRVGGADEELQVPRGAGDGRYRLCYAGLVARPLAISGGGEGAAVSVNYFRVQLPRVMGPTVP